MPHEELDVWQAAMRLALEVGRLVKPQEGVLGEEMLRTAVAIPTAVAEGHSKGGDRDFLKHLYEARSRIAALHSQILLGRELGLFDAGRQRELEELLEHVRRPLGGLIRFLAEKVAQKRALATVAKTETGAR